MSFEIQELPEVIRVIVLLTLSKGAKFKKSALKSKVDHICVRFACIDMSELDKALEEMKNKGLVTTGKEDMAWLTPEGQRLSKEWERLLLKKEPIMEM